MFLGVELYTEPKMNSLWTFLLIVRTQEVSSLEKLIEITCPQTDTFKHLVRERNSCCIQKVRRYKSHAVDDRNVNMQVLFIWKLDFTAFRRS